MEELALQKTWSFRFDVIRTGSSVLALLALAATCWSVRADHEQRRRALAIDLCEDWRSVMDTDETRQHLSVIEGLDEAGIIAVVAGLPIPAMQISADESCKLKRDAIRVLNLFEQIAIADRNGVASPELVRYFFAKSVSRHWARLGKFRVQYRLKEQDDWPGLDDTVLRIWTPTALSSMNPLP